MAWSEEYPTLTRWPDNIRQMEELGQAGVLPTIDVKTLRAAYIALRSAIHRRTLQDLNSHLAGDAFIAERDFIRSIWQRVMIE